MSADITVYSLFTVAINIKQWLIIWRTGSLISLSRDGRTDLYINFIFCSHRAGQSFCWSTSTAQSFPFDGVCQKTHAINPFNKACVNPFNKACVIQPNNYNGEEWKLLVYLKNAGWSQQVHIKIVLLNAIELSKLLAAQELTLFVHYPITK